MNDNELLRYSRHILLPQIDITGQETLLQSTALIIGLGGLGCPAAMYLAAAGIGKLILMDYDHIELSNLQRQIAHPTQNIKRPKVDSARETLLALNPDIDIMCLPKAADENTLASIVPQADIVLDACDNFATRFAINRACITHRKPLVSGAAIRFEGQIACYDTRYDASACYHCLYPEGEDVPESCSANGIFAPVVGIIGSYMAAEAMKALLQLSPDHQRNKLTIYDALNNEWRQIRLRRDPHCPSCSQRPSA